MATRTSQAYPTVSSDLPDDLLRWIERVTEVLDSRSSSRFVTAKELSAVGITVGTQVTTGTPTTVPPAPTGLAAAGAMTTIILTWDPVPSSLAARAEIFRADTDDVSLASKIGDSPAAATVYSDAVAPGSSYFYWVRFVSASGIAGSFQSTAGVQGTTQADVSYLLTVLNGAITNSQLNASLGSRINLIDVGPSSLVSVVSAHTTLISNLEQQVTQQTTTVYSTFGDENSENAGIAVLWDILQIDEARHTNRVNAAAVITEQITRATADSAQAAQTTQVIARLNDFGGQTGVTVEQAMTANANRSGVIEGRITTKIDVNGYVVGYGLIATENDGVPESDFIISVGHFALAAPSAPGVTPVFPFNVLTVETVVNGITVPPGVYMQGAHIMAGTIERAQIGLLAVDDARISSLSVSKLRTGTLDVGEVITIGDTVTIDGVGLIRTQSGHKRVDVTSGAVTAALEVGGVWFPYESLSHVEIGNCNSGDTVVIPGYFDRPPNVIVSPAVLTVSDPDFLSQKQTLNCSPGTISETSPGSMQYQFTPISQLELSDAVVAEAPNTRIPVSGEDTTNTWYSSGITSPANTDKVRPTVKVQSVRGTGTAPNYFYRQVAISIETWNGASWDPGGSLGTIALGANLGESAATQLTQFTFSSPDTWTWRLKFVASDAGGTFSAGSISYDYTTTSTGVAAATAIQDFKSDVNTGYPTLAGTFSYTLGSLPNPGAGWELYSVHYDYQVAGGCQLLSAGSPFGDARLDVPYGRTPKQFNVWYNNVTGTTGNFTFTNWAAGAFDLGAYDASAIKAEYLSRGNGAPNFTTTRVAFKFQNGQATGYWRKPVGNSVTPANHAILTSYIHTLSGATVIAAGTINWMAVG